MAQLPTAVTAGVLFEHLGEHAGADGSAAFAIAKCRPSSNRYGVMRSIVIVMLSPGSTISIPAGRETLPVMSEVRM